MAKTEISPDSPWIQSNAVTKMAEKWPLIDALVGGTDAMRDSGKAFLPQRPMECNADYEQRLSISTLLPAFSETVGAMVGRVFTKPVKLADNVSGDLVEMMANVDTEGRNLHTFARDWLADAMAYGISHVLVDYPKSDARTQADEKRAGVRPYAVHIKHDQILGWRSGNVEGSQVLTQVRIAESVNEDDGEFGTEVIEQVRVLERGRFRIYRRNADGNEHLHDEGVTSLVEISLITLYTNRTGFMLAVPPLLELAHLNAKHWRMQSGLDALIDTACVPILAISGVTPKFDEHGREVDGIVIGAKSAVELPAGADMKYVEHTGKAIEAGRQALTDLKDEMRQAGGKLLQKTEVNMTAAQANTENAKEISLLGMYVQNLEDALDQMLQRFGDWRGTRINAGNVQVQANLDPDYAPAESMQVLISLYNVGALSLQGLFAEAKRRGLIADDSDWEAEQERINAQGPAGADALAALMAKFREPATVE